MNQTLIVLILLLNPSASDPVPNRDMERALADLSLAVVQLKKAFAADPAGLRWNQLFDPMDGLEAAVRRNAETRVNITARKQELEAHGERLFGAAPILPKEDKHDGVWTFKPIRFEAIPRNLFIYGLKFKGSRTIRIRSVTLIFDDGDMVHNSWSAMENNNGKAFGKRTFTPYLGATPVGEPERARVLRAIEILGSAQDRDLASVLQFLVTIPDHADPPYDDALALLQSYRKSWPDRRLNQDNLHLCLDEIEVLARALNIDPTAF